MSVVIDKEKVKVDPKSKYMEVRGVRVYAPENHIPMWGVDKDEDGEEVITLNFIYQEPYKAEFIYTPGPVNKHENRLDEPKYKLNVVDRPSKD